MEPGTWAPGRTLDTGISRVNAGLGAGTKRFGYLISAICTPLCKMVVKVVVMLAAIWESVPVMIWLEDKEVVVSLWVPA